MKYWFVFNSKMEILLQKQGETYNIPCCDKLPFEITGEPIELPRLCDVEAVAVNTDIEACDGYEYSGLRNSYFILPFEEYYAAGKAAELTSFHNNTRYCAKCGKEMYRKTNISRECTGCGKEIWAPVQPAIIVLVQRGRDEVLLVRAQNFTRPYHGLVAGFVETGESLEECVRREVKEETGLNIKNIRYYKSQPWPYPNNIMCGFYADYESGEIKIQEEEIKCCNWYNRNALPDIPPKLSMARMLIDNWLENM